MIDARIAQLEMAMERYNHKHGFVQYTLETPSIEPAFTKEQCRAALYELKRLKSSIVKGK